MPSEEALALFHARLAAYRGRTSAALVAAWDDLDAYRDEDVDAYIARVSPLLAGAKSATVAASVAFFALSIGIAAPAVSAKDVALDPRTADSFLATWHALKEGRPFDDAVAAGRSQAQAVGFDFVQSTSRRTGDRVAEAAGRRVRWRRVPGGNACAWCHLVAGQEYATAESADFGHSRCDCVAVPA